MWRDAQTTVTALPESMQPIDSTGAGDAFAAGVLAGWLTGASPHAALQAGHRLAAIACASVGARPPAG